MAARGTILPHNIVPAGYEGRVVLPDLPKTLDLNGSSVLCSWHYNARDATVAAWRCREQGSNLTQTGSGDNPIVSTTSPSDFYGSVTAQGGKHYTGAGTPFDLGTDDYVIEFIAKNGNEASGLTLFNHVNTTGIAATVTTLGRFSWSHLEATGTVALATASLTASTWRHLMLFVDRDLNATTGGQWYVDGALSSGANYSARQGTLTVAIDAWLMGRSSVPTASAVAHFMGWHKAAWMTGADGVAERATIAARRYETVKHLLG